MVKMWCGIVGCDVVGVELRFPFAAMNLSVQAS
nr:MAG TPA: hypothetical protein [Podoviridae sp. ctgHy19]